MCREWRVDWDRGKGSAGRNEEWWREMASTGDGGGSNEMRDIVGK